MDDVTIRAVAEAVRQESWVPLLTLFLTGVLTAGAIIAGAYLKSRGEHLASKADIESLVSQARQTTQAIEEAKASVERQSSDEKTRLQHHLIQDPVLNEVTRLIVRFRELFNGEFLSDYDRHWSPSRISLIQLERSKRDTCVYRFFRLMSQIHIYNYHASGLPFHESHSFFNFYIERKIIPALASGSLPGPYVLWRDAVLEIGEIMTEHSEKWNLNKPINWFEFARYVQSEDDRGKFINNYASRVCDLIRRPNVRLAVLTIYLIDIVQDTRDYMPWEGFRNDLLNFIRDSKNNDFSLYGRTEDGFENDIAVMDIEKGLVPCNNRAPRFKPEKNLGYPLPQ